MASIRTWAGSRGWLALAVALGLGLGSSPSAAAGEQEVEKQEESGARALHRGLLGLEAGAGVYGFTDGIDRFTGPGASWSGALIVGLNYPLAVEVSYTGALNPITNDYDYQHEFLVSTIVEGTLRLNLFNRSRIMPFLFGGVGWYALNLDEDNVVQLQEDDAVTVPLGVGAHLLISPRWAADIRFTYRFLTRAELGPDYEIGGGSWDGGVRFGTSF